MLETAATLNCLGVLHFHSNGPDADDNNANTAMEYYQQSLSLRRAVLGIDCETKEIATTLNNIGRVYYMKGRYEKSLEFYDPALDMRRRLLGVGHIDVAASVF